MHSPPRFCTAMLWTAICSLKLNSPHISNTSWCRGCLNCTKGPHVQIWPLLIPRLNPPSEGSASLHRAVGPRGVTTTEQLPAGSQLTAKGKQLLEEAHKLFSGKMSGWSVREAPLHHEPKRASDAYILGCWTCYLQGRKFNVPSFAVWAFPAFQRQIGPFWRNNCFLLTPLGLDGSQCPALGSHNTPCQTQALFIMPEMLNSNASTSPPLSFGRWEPTFMHKQLLLQIFQMAFPPPGAHTLPPQITKPEPSEGLWQKRDCLTTKHWGPF